MSDNVYDNWNKMSSQDDWIDFILPKRTEQEFWDEGQAQAYEIANLFSKDNVILEYGCGVGRVLKYLTAKEKHGADTCSKFISLIDQKDIITHLTDGKFPFIDDDYFDFIYSLMVFQHNSKDTHFQILSTLYKCLKHNGKIYIQFPQNPNEYYKQTSFVNLYDKKELVNLFESVGFKAIKITEGNLVAYGANGEYTPTGNLEYFVTAYK